MTIKGQGMQELFYRFIFVVHWQKFEAIPSGDGEGVEGEDERVNGTTSSSHS